MSVHGRVRVSGGSEDVGLIGPIYREFVLSQP
jgi:hypothetical protein